MELEDHIHEVLDTHILEEHDVVDLPDQPLMMGGELPCTLVKLVASIVHNLQ